MDYYADAEGGAYLEDPTHADLAGLASGLNTSDNTFFVVCPADQDLEWFVSVSKNVRAFGCYEVPRYDPSTNEDTTTTAADPRASPPTCSPGSPTGDPFRNRP